jgi:hypothetical protein
MDEENTADEEENTNDYNENQYSNIQNHFTLRESQLKSEGTLGGLSS